jgi:Bacteriocin-protection, YdeI or OmpD-Associated
MLTGVPTPEPTVPADLRKVLAAAPAAKAAWSDLTPIARRDFISWIDGAKQAETRARRIERTCSMMLEGKRRPCCFSIVPLSPAQCTEGRAESEGAVEHAHADGAQRLHQLDRFSRPAGRAKSPYR